MCDKQKSQAGLVTSEASYKQGIREKAPVFLSKIFVNFIKIWGIIFLGALMVYATDIVLNAGDPITKTVWDELVLRINNNTTKNAVQDTAISGKAEIDHFHDERYYTEAEINAKIIDINIPSGAVMAFHLNVCPAGWIPCNGVNGTPDLRDRAVTGSSGTRGVGSFEEDAVPNITGAFNPAQRYLQIPQGISGAFYGDGVNYGYRETGEGLNGGKILFNASRSSPVYGRNGTTEVRVDNVALLFCKKT